MNFSKWMSPLALCAACGFAGSAQAADEGWYGVAFGGEFSVSKNVDIDLITLGLRYNFD